MKAWHLAGGLTATMLIFGLIAAASGEPEDPPPDDEPEPEPGADPEDVDEQPDQDPEDADEPEDSDPGFKEDRVRVADFASLAKTDPRLKVLPEGLSYGGTRRVHHQVYASLLDLLAAAEAAGLPALRVSSAWRPHRWESFAHYEAEMIKQYGSLAEGRKWKAYASPHETGLAVDLRNSDLRASSATAAQQKKSATYAWLKAHAHEFGWTPYLREPWHWEQRITPAEFAS